MKIPKKERLTRRWYGMRWMVLGVLFLMPVPATLLSAQFNWSAGDFVVWGAMLLGVGLAYEFLAGRADHAAYRWGVGLALAAAFLLIWVSLAVGLIGSEDNPANLMYAGVLGVGLLGAIAVRFRPQGMAWVMLIVALAQMVAGGLALVAGWGTEGASWPRDVVVGTVFFTAFWLGAAVQFRRAAQG